jgi:GntR family transcriptional regulator of vanillate catabolism
MNQVPSQSSLAQAAYEEIKAQICDGIYAMGEKVPEAECANAVGTSRTPVRIALSRLEAEGLLTHDPKRGFRVTTFTVADVREIYSVRALMETEAVRLAARLGVGERGWRRLRSLNESMGLLLNRRGDDQAVRAEFQALNFEFHNLIYDHCGNRFLRRQIAAVAELPLALRNYSNFSSRELQESHVAHSNILSALEKGEGDRAAALMREHIWAARDRMVSRKTRRTTRRQGHAVSPRGKLILKAPQGATDSPA